MHIAAKRAHTRALIALERAGELFADSGIACSLKIDKENRAVEHRSETIRAFAGEVGHRSGATCGSEREEELAFGLESGEPCGKWMSRTGADDNNIGRIEWALRAVGMNDDDLRPGLKRDARTNGECFVNFDGDDFALRAGQFGKDGGVVAGAATKMKKAVAGVDFKQ